ncbi:MAG: putative toxin-antitoxin system toxin component, PIN family [Bifidobacteriaceae bacterium]|jgi:putative PIN family toxin of toxin-antitoxin system|nr:putative toxin-antitoxin system toxin component, PIN family [Bifidobacteriaceae bacterium]
MKRVVLDTNVLVVAARSRRGASFQTMRALRARRFTALVSVPLVLEYEAVLKRPEQLAAAGRTAAMTDAFLDALCAIAEPVELFYLWRPQARDPDDDMVLETAMNGRADWLVSLNTRDLEAACLRLGMPLATPGDFYRHHLNHPKED